MDKVRPQLDVKGFSCIDSASLQISDMTVIIGPQASGKSVLCKLYYFFNEVISSLPRTIQEASDFDDASNRVLEDFGDWFRPSSWGTRAFTLTFTIGDAWIQISRTRSRSKNTRAKIAFSASLTKAIGAAFLFLKSPRKGVTKEASSFGFDWTMYETLRDIIHKPLVGLKGEHHLYIPAGRSFFTSIGKIVTAFEDRSMLDPVVTRFGRFITSIRDHQFLEPEEKSPMLEVLEKLIDGEVVNEKGKQFLATPDGRSIPFSALSSGQQELLPLLSSLQYALYYRTHVPHLLYIEEPEAHLFPSAQTAMVELFSRMIAPVRPNKNQPNNQAPHSIRTILTTHSPYVLAKINNLIKAGSLAPKLNPEKRRELDRLIPQNSWLSPGKVSAYAIQGRKLVNIVDKDGLINADYIDDVSAATGIEFDSMLELEMLA